MRLSDFNIEDGLSGGLIADVVKLGQLSEDEFKEAHKNEMIDFFESHSKQGDKLPICDGCRISIGNPERLIRYFGRNLHPDCFVGVYSGERKKLKEIDQKYFDLILKNIV